MTSEQPPRWPTRVRTADYRQHFARLQVKCWRDAVRPVVVSTSRRAGQRGAVQHQLFQEECFCCQPLQMLWLCKTLALSLLLISPDLHADPEPAPVWAPAELTPETCTSTQLPSRSPFQPLNPTTAYFYWKQILTGANDGRSPGHVMEK